MATHSSTLAWRIPWTEEPGRLQSKGSQKVHRSLVSNSPWDHKESNTDGSDSMYAYRDRTDSPVFCVSQGRLVCSV